MLSLDEVGEATATDLYQDGFRSVMDVAGASVTELIQVKGISEEKAERIIQSAKQSVSGSHSADDGEEEGEMPKEDVSDGEG